VRLTHYQKFPGDSDRVSRMSLIQEGYPQNIRMAFLAIVGSHKVNGVAQLHSDLIKLTIFKDFVDFYGVEKFINVTNGVTPRRWLNQCNPKLSELITRKLGNDNWIKHLSDLSKLREFAADQAFEDEFMAIKHANKVRLAQYIKHVTDIDVPAHFMFDIQVKRMHEYKRQLMNILGVIYRYNAYKNMSPEERSKETPHAVMLGGKAAPGYFIAKLVIKLINAVADTVNNDPDVKDILKVVFLPNYNVSFAEIIIPANDISQHISTAGTEASGTSNMKFVLNGGVILGTVDGANIEIGEEVGKDNIFFFGVLTPEVEGIRRSNKEGKNPMNPKVKEVCDLIRSGKFGEGRVFEPLLSTYNHRKANCEKTPLNPAAITTWSMQTLTPTLIHTRLVVTHTRTRQAGQRRLLCVLLEWASSVLIVLWMTMPDKFGASSLTQFLLPKTEHLK
jgi:starch phosphorylase